MLEKILHHVHGHMVKNAPKALALPSTLMPFPLQKVLLNELLTRVFSEAIEDGDLDFLNGHFLKVSVTDLNLLWFISFENNKLIIKPSCEAHHVSFSGNANDLILIAGRKEDPDTLFFQRRLKIEGDTELGLEVKNLLDNIDHDNFPDWVNKTLDQFANFVKNGMQKDKQTFASV